MPEFCKTLKTSALVCFLTLLPAASFGQHYQQTNLVSNVPKEFPNPGNTPPVKPDPAMQNPWGLVAGPGTPFWDSNNGSGTSTLYDGTGALLPLNQGGQTFNGMPVPQNGILVPNAPSQPAPGSPTAVMFNGSGTDFLIQGNPAIFIYATEDGTISGWAPNAYGGNFLSAIIVVDNSQMPNAKNGAVYKGATIVEIHGKKYILAANFRSGLIDVFDSKFHQVSIDDDAFDDDQMPKDFAPFNVQAIGPNIYVTYAKQDATKHDPIGGAGLGRVSIFSPDGKLLGRLEHGSFFDAPWGITLAPGSFGEFSHTLLVGNFRNGWIDAFNPLTGKFMGLLLQQNSKHPVKIDGLWALVFGNDSNNAPATTLYFTAGPDKEKNGLFGTLTPDPNEQGDGDEQ
ncbi:MAG TPA: TIGR03118 family protein [Candidatus Eremiobacteraceae bacterium]|nr:TIGR03118 family protein [Candidatus Eremiobacteraceae bacterium]